MRLSGQTKAAMAIGSVAGGLVAYYITRNKPWAAVKKVAAVAVGAFGGAAAGYGVMRIPVGNKHGYRMAGTSVYPTYESGDSLIRESVDASSTYTYTKARGKKKRIGARSNCTRPEDQMRGDMLQWVELVKTPQMLDNKIAFTQSVDLYHYLRDGANSPQENMYVVMLNNRNEPLGHVLVSRGTKSQALVGVDDVFRPAILAGAARIVVSHNHPSGDPTPSPQDIALTRQLEEGGRNLNIPLLDHIIVTHRGYASLRDIGVIR